MDTSELQSEEGSLIVDTLLYSITDYTKTCSIELNELLSILFLYLNLAWSCSLTPSSGMREKIRKEVNTV